MTSDYPILPTDLSPIENQAMSVSPNCLDSRSACLIFEACKGFRREARTLAVDAFRLAGVTVSRGDYVSIAECSALDGRKQAARYVLQMTDEQADDFCRIAAHLATLRGWEAVPWDFYHD